MRSDLFKKDYIQPKRCNKFVHILLKKGKNDWGKTFPTCKGQGQSPIDINTSNLPEKEVKPFIFHGYDSTFKKSKLENNGHSVKMSIQTLNKAQSQPGVLRQYSLIGMYVYLLTFHYRFLEETWTENTLLPSIICTGDLIAREDLNTSSIR